MRILIVFIAVGWLLLWWRMRRLERRLVQLQDKSVDWRLRLGRRQEELAEDIASLRAGRFSEEGTATPGGGSDTGAAALIQIRPREPIEKATG